MEQARLDRRNTCLKYIDAESQNWADISER